jgi:hypothetical protein
VPLATTPWRVRAQDAEPAARSEASDAAADTAALPAYLEELRILARETLARGDSLAGAAAPVASGRGTAADYRRFVERAVLEGIIEADSVRLTRPVVPRMLVRDQDAIAYLFACCAYDEVAADSIRFVEIYDFGRSGFSNGDLMICHPSGRSYLLEGLTPEFLAAAATWARADQLEVTRYTGRLDRMTGLAAELAPPDSFVWEPPPPDLPPDEDVRQALRAIWSGVHRSVADQYRGGPLELHFVRGDSTTSVEVWGFDADSLRFRYLPPGGAWSRNDLLTVTVGDTVVRTLASYLDVLVITESRTDTVRVPARR